MALVWRDTMAVGQEPIDADHKKFFALVNATEKCIAEWNLALLNRAFESTKELVESHFALEEDLMKSLGFPGIDGHVAFHRDLERKISLIYGKFQTSKDQKDQLLCANMFLKLMTDHIANHLIKEDLRLRPYFVNKKVETAEVFFVPTDRHGAEPIIPANFTKTILVVDDIEFMRRQMGHILRGAGFANVVDADEGGKAFEMLRAAPDLYGLVISDLDMNPTNGLHLLTLMRMKEEAPLPVQTLPFVMLTSDGGAKRIDELRRAGAYAAVVKPFTGNTLLDVTYRILGCHRAPG